MRRIEIKANGLTFRALAEGEGPLVLLLHGFPDTPYTFRELIPVLARAGYRAVAPWMRGYAPTEIPVDGNYQAVSLGQDAVALIDAIGGDDGERAAVIGHDWGASAAFLASLLAPEKISRFSMLALPHPAQFLMALSGSYLQSKRSWYMYFFQLPFAVDAVRSEDFRFLGKLWRDWSPGFEPPPGLLEEMRDSLKEPENTEAALGVYRALFDPARQDPERTKLQDELAARTPECSALAIVGAKDGCIGVEVSEGMEAFFPAGLERHVIASAGHFLHLEAPGEVSRLLLEFLNR
ncbi:MAG: alpha/beta hydrolase [Deltaproteobacteria bacterium]|nr:alpha/beta hydrolase [Deltaproteobacteria bacterium]